MNVHQWAVLKEQRGLALRLEPPSMTGIPIASTSAAGSTTSAAHLVDMFCSTIQQHAHHGNTVAQLMPNPAACDTAPAVVHVAPRNRLLVHQLAARVEQAVTLCQAVWTAFPVFEVLALQAPITVRCFDTVIIVTPCVGGDPGAHHATGQD